MAVGVKCPSCGRQFRAKDRHRGRETNCPGCGRALVVEGERVPDYDVFVSYSSKDKPVADAVCAALEAARFRCWIAPRDILPGVEWGSAIVDAIRESPVFVLIYTAHSNQSQQVLREVERAVSKGAAIVPVRLEDVPPSKTMEYFISASHWLDAMGGPLEAHVEQLVRTVGSLLKQRTAPAEVTPAGVAPLPPPPAPLAPPAGTRPGRGRTWGLALAAAVAVLVVAMGAVLVLRGKRGVASDAGAPGGAVSYAAQPPSSAPTVADDGPRTVNLLALAQPDRDRVSGVWMAGESGLGVLGRGRGMAGLVLPYVPPEEYDFRLEFTGPSGAGSVLQVCTAGGQAFGWIVKQRRAGFSMLRGRPFGKASVPLPGAAIPSGRTVSLVQVRRDIVRAYLNGVLILEAAPSDLRMARPGRQWNLGLGAEGTPATFHAIEVVELNGRGTTLRERPAAIEGSIPDEFGTGDEGK